MIEIGDVVITEYGAGVVKWKLDLEKTLYCVLLNGDVECYCLEGNIQKEELDDQNTVRMEIL